MTNPSLSQLYRQLTVRPSLSARALLDSETAVRAATARVVPHERDDVAAALAGSASHADLVRLLRALTPASAELAQSLAQFAPVHDQRERAPRTATARRRDQRGWQWGAVAAGFVAAVALFAARTSVHGLGDQSALAQMPRGDQIFDGGEAILAAHDMPNDVIRAMSMDSSDQIFRGRLGGG